MSEEMKLTQVDTPGDALPSQTEKKVILHNISALGTFGSNPEKVSTTPDAGHPLNRLFGFNMEECQAKSLMMWSPFNPFDWKQPDLTALAKMWDPLKLMEANPFFSGKAMNLANLFPVMEPAKMWDQCLTMFQAGLDMLAEPLKAQSKKK
ncbi:MAG: hypothetical protein HQK57_10265 [Deltaproteobacteria bacterium]|nr:hypothetical protein [Deltaproteobacteria bacterium]